MRNVVNIKDFMTNEKLKIEEKLAIKKEFKI